MILEYEESGLGVKDVKKMIEEKKVFYDHNADKKQKKWSSNIKLIKEDELSLPDYITKNKRKFADWLD